MVKGGSCIYLAFLVYFKWLQGSRVVLQLSGYRLVAWHLLWE